MGIAQQLSERFMRRTWVRRAGAVAVVVAVVLLLVPLLVDVDRFRPTVEAQMSTALGRSVRMGHLSLSLLRGSLVAQQITIADDPAYSHEPMLTAKSLRIGVSFFQLLLKRQLSVTALTIESPSIQLLEGKDGHWNYSSLGGNQPEAESKPATKGPLPAFRVEELRIVNGRAVLGRVGSTRPPLEVSAINLTLRKLSMTEASPFLLTAKLSGGADLKAEGTVGPIAQNDASLTPFQAKAQLKRFDMEKAGGVLAQSGLDGVMDLEAQAASTAGLVSLKGKMKVERLRLVRSGSATREPVEVDFALGENLSAQSLQIDDVALQAGPVAAHLRGSVNLAGDEPLLDLKLSAPGMSIDGLENLLPAVGVTLPSGSRLRGGTLTATLAVTGPADKAVAEGPVVVSDTVLSGYDLGAHIGGVNPFGGSGQGTKVQTLRMELRATSEAEQLNSIYADLPQVGTATGSGTVSARQELNFNLLAKFNPTTGVGMVLGRGMSALTGFLGKATHSKAADGVPVSIQGPASNPSIHAHLGEMLMPQLSGKKLTGKKR